MKKEVKVIPLSLEEHEEFDDIFSRYTF